jgi:hypothetical protein
VILGLQSGFAAVAVLKRRGGGGAATFRWCGAAGEIGFTSIMFRRKQKRRIRGQEFVVRGQDAARFVLARNRGTIDAGY